MEYIKGINLGDVWFGLEKDEIDSFEHPPKIDEPVPVAPLENPATETAPEPKVEESAKLVDAPAPVVTAAA